MDSSAADALAVGESLNYQINHIFLPPKLPLQDDTTAGNDMKLMQTVRQALNHFRRHFQSDERPELERCLGIIDKMISLRDNNGLLTIPELQKEIKNLRDEDSLALHIRSQNAALLITRAGQELLFESFELLAQDNEVTKCSGRLRRRFPGPAIAVGHGYIMDATFIGPLVNVLVRLDHGSNRTDGDPLTSKDEDPRLVTEMLTGLLRGVGRPADVSRIIKHSREEVFTVSDDPSFTRHWRRSPLWLHIRVSLRLLFDRTITSTPEGQSKSLSLYKEFMIFFMSSILSHACQQGVTSHLLFIIKAKISRRILKLGRPDTAKWFRYTEEVMSHVQDILTRDNENIQSIAGDILDLSTLSSLDFGEDTAQTMGTLRQYTESTYNHQSVEPSEDQSVQGAALHRIEGHDLPRVAFKGYESDEFGSEAQTDTDSDDYNRRRYRRPRWDFRQESPKRRKPRRWRYRGMRQQETLFYELADLQNWVKSCLPAQDDSAPEAMIPHANFQHRHLEKPDDIRLLRLHPSPLYTDVLSFSVVHVDLNEDHEYIAISYACDGQEFDHLAICDGQRYPISRNCDDIMRHLRQKTHSVSLWIDQVCICQTSKNDKNRNIRRMADIFRKSRAVFIWTGLVDDTTLDLLCRLTKRTTTVEKYIDSHNSIDNSGSDAEDRFTQPRPLPQRRNQRDIFTKKEDDEAIASKFDNRTWFSRMWTVQEVALVEHFEIFFLTGRILVSLPDLAVSLPEASMKPHFVQLMTANFHFFMYGLQERSKTQQQGTSSTETHRSKIPTSPSKILSQVRRRQCYDPRDKIFPLWWMIDTGPRFPDADLPLANPDYKKSVDRVYKEITAWALKTQGDHRILYMAPLSPSETSDSLPTASLPSWVPDYARLSLLFRPQSLPIETRAGDHYYDTSQPHKFDFKAEILSDLAILRIQAKICDSVRFVSKEMPLDPHLNGVISYSPTSTDVSEWQRTILKTLIEFFLSVLWPLRPETKESFRRSILLDSYDKDEAFKDWYSHFEAWAETLYASRQQAAVITAEPRPKSDDEDENPAEMGEATIRVSARLASQYDEFARRHHGTKMREVFANLSKHCLFSTTEGHVGLVFGAIQDSDVVAIARGVDRILILRPSDAPDSEKFTLAGVAYIHAYMKEKDWCKGETVMKMLDIV